MVLLTQQGSAGHNTYFSVFTNNFPLLTPNTQETSCPSLPLAHGKKHLFLRGRMKSPLNLRCDAQETNRFTNPLAQEDCANSKVAEETRCSSSQKEQCVHTHLPS